MSASSPPQLRGAISARLRARRPEIDEEVMTRVQAVSDPLAVADPDYAEGLRAAVFAAIDHSLASVEEGAAVPSTPPAALLEQARLAVRVGVSLETVLRRCLAGHTVLGDFILEAAEANKLGADPLLRRVLRGQGRRFDGLLAAVGREYAREQGRRLRSAEQRQAERVEGLLRGELVETWDLPYDFSDNHLGLVGIGPGPDETIRALALELDCRPLLVRRQTGSLWAWLGARHSIDPDEVRRRLTRSWPGAVAVAIGEPGVGLAGWRLTHRQALAALPVARRDGRRIVHYSEVALLATMFGDELLGRSLQETFLAPLGDEDDGGGTLRQTLRAYFVAERNISSTAAALGVSRHTVAKRLRAVEAKLHRPLHRCTAELEAALRLENMASDSAIRCSHP